MPYANIEDARRHAREYYWRNRKHLLEYGAKLREFRGWLCDRCNVGIGCLGDNLEGVQKAAKYLSTT